MRAAIAQLERRAIASGRAFNLISVDINQRGTVADITVPIAGNGTDTASNAAFRLLRETIVPETVGALPNTEAGVTRDDGSVEGLGRQVEVGPAAGRRLRAPARVRPDAGRVPPVVIAAKAVLLNLLSVAPPTV